MKEKVHPDVAEMNEEIPSPSWRKTNREFKIEETSCPSTFMKRRNPCLKRLNAYII